MYNVKAARRLTHVLTNISRSNRPYIKRYRAYIAPAYIFCGHFHFTSKQKKSPVPKNRGMISKALIFLGKLALGELRRTTGSLQAVLYLGEPHFHYYFITICDCISIRSAVCYTPQPVLCACGGQAIFMSVRLSTTLMPSEKLSTRSQFYASPVSSVTVFHSSSDMPSISRSALFTKPFTDSPRSLAYASMAAFLPFGTRIGSWS